MLLKANKENPSDSWSILDQTKIKPAAQAVGQTLPDAAPPVGKIHPFSKIAVTFKPIKQFMYPTKLNLFEKR